MERRETEPMRLARFLLAPVSILFGFAVWVRGRCYDAGVFRSVKVPVPVISVGNMTAGGTGKTPMVEYLVRLLRADGMRVAVVSRGYRREGTGTYVVSDGATLRGTALGAGDEPFQIARKFRDVVVIVDERKSRAARRAVEEFGAEVVLVDDGFQHRALARDLDIVMIDSTKHVRAMRLLPSGLRRETMGGLGRADAVVYSRCGDPAHRHEAFPEASGAVACCVRPVPTRCVELTSGAEVPIERLRGSKVVAVCGIGDPASFERTLSDAGCTILATYAYPDHHRFTAHTLGEIARGASRHAPEYCLTTEKDAVRLLAEPAWSSILPARTAYVEMAHEFVRGEAEFRELVRAAALRRAA